MGKAFTDVIFGHENPSGKLIFTMPNKNNETQMALEQYPGIGSTTDRQVIYSEGKMMGYRWYEKHEVLPAYPFGFGLSYTTFDMKLLNLTSSLVSIQLKNTGKMFGKEVVQVYVAPPETKHITGKYRSVKDLKQFAKVGLEPGQTKNVTITLTNKAYSYWNSDQ